MPKISKNPHLPATQSKRSARLSNGLTVKQQAYAKLVAEGNNYSEAYRQAYDLAPEDRKKPWVASEAFAVRHKPHVAEEIERLIAIQDEMQSTQARSRAVRITATLEQIMAQGKTETAKLRAAEMLGKTIGLFAANGNDDAETGKTLAELERRLSDLLKG